LAHSFDILRMATNPFATTAHHHLIAPTAQCKKPPIAIGLRQRRDAKKTAEERFNMLARGWLAYPVTSIHSQLPPKSGCRNHIPGLQIIYTTALRR
jgi:hypothetical protein